MQPVSWGTLGLTVTDEVFGLFDARNTYPVSASIQTTSRRGTYPLLASISHNQRDIPLTLLRPVGSALSSSAFIETVEGAFAEGAQATLTVLLGDGITEAQIDCIVASRARTNALGVFETVLTTLRPYFESTSLNTDTTSPVVNAGNHAVLPSLELTCSTHGTRQRWTVAGAGRGGGLKQVPIRFAVNDANLTASNAYVYVNGKSGPFHVGDAGLSTSFIWALVDTKSDGTATTVDIVYRSGVVNPLAGALDDGGMDWSLTGSTNTTWKWDDLTVGGRTGRAGVWRPALIYDRSGASAGLTVNTGTSLEIANSQTGVYANDADAIVMETGGLGFSNLANVSRVIVTNGSTRYVKTRDAGSSFLATDWSSGLAGTVTADIPLTNGVQISIGSAVIATTSTTFTLSKAGGSPWTLTLANTPTVTLVHTQNLDYYDSTLVIGGTTITFTDYLVDDGSLFIEHGESGWRIRSSVAGARTYGPENRIAFSDPDVFLSLAAGSNAVVNSITGCTWSLSWRNGWS